MKIGFIGAGNMGGALAKAAAVAGFADRILLCDKDTAKAEALAAEIGAQTAGLAGVAACDVIFLGVKPQHLAGTVAELLPFIKGTPLFVSMAAGVKLEKLDALTGDRFPIIRIMPNTPVAVGAGVIAYAPNARVNGEQLALFGEILSRAGVLAKLEEGKIDAECAVAGCGPAFAAMFIEAMADGGVLCGLTRQDALLFARETLRGTAVLMAETNLHPGELKDRVCSPGGSTVAGVKTLEEGAFRATVIDAVTAAFKRTEELGK